MTPQELLHKWIQRQEVIHDAAGRRYDDSPETNKMLLNFEFVLAQCIKELDDVLSGRAADEDFISSLKKVINDSTV